MTFHQMVVVVVENFTRGCSSIRFLQNEQKIFDNPHKNIWHLELLPAVLLDDPPALPWLVSLPYLLLTAYPELL